MPLDGQPEQEPMTEDEVVNAVKKEINWASDLRRDDLDGNRVLAWDYFNGRKPGAIDEDVDEFFQEVVSRDVANAVEATLAEILPAFATDRPAAFDPIGPGDEEQAELESDICNDILMEAGAGFLDLTTAAKNALLLRIGVIEIIWEDQVDVHYKTIPQATPQMLAMLALQNSTAEIRPIEGMPNGVEVRSRSRRQKCRPEAVPTDEFLVSSDATSLDLDRARFVGRQLLISRSDLKAMGFDPQVVDELKPYTSTQLTRSRSSRERNTWGREKHSGDKNTEMVMCVRCYYRLDEDRDGIAELRYILVAGTYGSWTILHDEPTTYQPFAAGAAYIWPHMPYGISLFDKLKSVQDIRTKFRRILLEAGQRNARDRALLGPGVEMEDWLTSRFGGGIRGPAGSVTAIPAPAFPGQLMMLDEITRQDRREGGGGAIDKSAAENMPVEAGAHGVERMLTAIEELNAMVARMIAETLVKQSYVKIQTVLRTYSPTITREINGQWVQINPRTWQPRDKVSVATGLTGSERARLAASLGYLADKQIALIEADSILANEVTLYRTLQDQARMMGLQNPQSYLVDPRSLEGEKAARQKQQNLTQQAQQTQQQAAMQAQLQAQVLGTVEQIKQQGALQKEAMKLAQDQQQFLLELGQKFDQLRVQVLEIEAKYGEQNEEPIQSEA